jgi:hypothetical protein
VGQGACAHRHAARCELVYGMRKRAGGVVRCSCVRGGRAPSSILFFQKVSRQQRDSNSRSQREVPVLTTGFANDILAGHRLYHSAMLPYRKGRSNVVLDRPKFRRVPSGGSRDLAEWGASLRPSRYHGGMSSNVIEERPYGSLVMRASLAIVQGDKPA